MTTPDSAPNTVPDSEPDSVIEAHGLRKHYGSFEAVGGIDFRVQRGECFGFLGPNGAGKSTTMRMIYRAIPVGGGQLRILGHEVGTGANDRAIKRRIGVVPQEFNLDERLSARDNLQVFARFYGLYGRAAAERVDQVLAAMALQDRHHAAIETLSGGLKRRVQIARGLLGNPDILVLDEPTTGLDPTVRNILWNQLFELKRGNTTLILSTHYMDEAEKLCDRLVIMDGGRIIAAGTPPELIDAHTAPYVVELRVSDADADATIAARFATHIVHHQRVAERLLLYTDDGEGLLHAVVQGFPDYMATLRHANLEDVFVRITGRALDR